MIWRRARAGSRPFVARLERIVLVAAIVGFLSAFAALVLQGAVGEGSTFWSAARPDTVKEVLGTRFGRAWGLGALAWLIVLAALALRPLRGTPPSPARLTALGVPLFALVLLPSLGGHTSVQSPVAILLPANILHVLSMSAWLGGVAVLVLALRSATAELEPDARTPLLADIVGRFSALASIALPVLLLSGVLQAVVEVRSFPALLDSAFGRSVLIKVVIALAIIALGYVNRQRLVPALRKAAADHTSPGHAGVLLRRTLRFELALGLAAIAATGALSSYAPSVAESAGPYSANVTLGPTRLEVTVDPAKVGPNQLHMYLFDRKTGAAFDQTKELRVTAAMPSKQIAPIELSAHVAGPGHYIVDDASLAVAGDWTVAVTNRISDFDEYETRFTVPIE